MWRGKRRREEDRATAYLRAAIDYIAPLPPQLIAVGGLSGTGKSTLAAALAPSIAPTPGAVHLRSDLERKVLLGAAETERLPATAYTPEVNARVYDVLRRKARTVLAAGHSVIVDAVFLRDAERDGLQQVAHDQGVRFAGLWLTAPAEVMVRRVTERTNDASDATPDVVRRQIEWQGRAAATAWSVIDASRTTADTLHDANDVIGMST